MSTTSTATIWMDRVALSVAWLNSAILFIVLAIQLRKRESAVPSGSPTASPKADSKSAQQRLMPIFALGSLLFSVVYLTQRTIAAMGIGDCHFHDGLGATLWMTAKVNMYLFFISRLHVAFNDSHSAFGFSSTSFVFFYVLAIGAYVSVIVVYGAFSSGSRMYDANNQPFCGTTAPFWTFLYIAVWDFVVSTLLSYFFVKRMSDAFLVCLDASDKRTLKTVSRIAKYVTLGLIGVSTTFFSLVLLGFLQWFLFIALDVIINGWCVLMMFATNARLFSLFCGSCHRLTGRCFFKCIMPSIQTFKRAKSITGDNATLAQTMCAEIYELQVNPSVADAQAIRQSIQNNVQLDSV